MTTIQVSEHQMAEELRAHGIRARPASDREKARLHNLDYLYAVFRNAQELKRDVLLAGDAKSRRYLGSRQLVIWLDQDVRGTMIFGAAPVEWFQL